MTTTSIYQRPILRFAAGIALCATILLCGAHQAHVDSVQYIEHSWDDTKVASETKTAECAPITKDTENIQGWYYVSGAIESENRIKVAEGAEANIILTDASKLTLEKGINVYWSSNSTSTPSREKQAS